MSANPEPGDDANGSFGPARRELHDQSPGHEPVEQNQGVAEEGRHKRRSSGGEVPRTGLAERVRQREAGE